MHPQDCLFVAEALVALADDARTQTPRQCRAWELADALWTQIDEGMVGTGGVTSSTD